MRNIIPAIATVLFLPIFARFYTITKEAELTHERVIKRNYISGIKQDTTFSKPCPDSIAVQSVKAGGKYSFAQKGYDSTSQSLKEGKPVLRTQVSRTDGCRN